MEKRVRIDYTKPDISITALWKFASTGRCAYCGEKDKNLLIEAYFKMPDDSTFKSNACKNSCIYYP